MADSSVTESKLRITAEDATGVTLANISRGMETMGRNAERASRQSASATSAIQRALGGLTGFQRQIGAAAISFGSGLVTRKSIVEFADLERQITSLHHTLGLGTEGLDDTRRKIFEVAVGTGQTADKVVKAYQTIAAAGGTTADETDKLVKMSAKAALAMDANIDETAKMGVLYKMAGNDMAGVERMFARVTSASQKGRFEGRDFAANFEDINLIMKQLGYSGDEGLNKVLAMLTQVRTQSASSSAAVDNLRDVTAKMMAPETFANFKKFGGADLWNEQDARASRAAGKDLGMMFIQATKLLMKRNELKGKPITSQDILQDLQARTALAAMTGDVEGMIKLFKEFRDTDLTINDKQFEDKMKQARAAVDNFETKLFQLRTSLGKGLVDAGALDIVNSLASFLERAGIGAERLGAAVKSWREGKGTGALQDEIAQNFRAHREHGNTEARDDLIKRRADATTDTQRADIDKMIDKLTDAIESDRAKRGEAMAYPAPLPPELRNYGPNVKPITPEQGEMARAREALGSGRIRPRDPSAPGSATEGTAREGLDEQRKTREVIERLRISPISYGVPPGGGEGDGGGESASGRTYGGGGRFNGLGGSGGVGGSMGGGIRSRGARGGGDGGEGGAVDMGGGGGGRDTGGTRGAAKTSYMMRIAMEQLRREGVPEGNLRAAAAHLVGQAYMESGLDPNKVHDGGTGYGIYGARDPKPGRGRRTNMLRWLAANGYAKNSAEGQMRYMAHEAMTGGYQQTRRILMGAQPGNIAGQTSTITREFESPAVVNNRSGATSNAYKVGPEAPPQQSGQPPGPAAAAPSLQPVEVPVRFRYDGMNVPGIRDRGASQARREMDRDVRQARHTTYSDVGVA